MALDPNYGNRIRGYAEQQNPQAFAPVPQLSVVQRQPMQMPALPNDPQNYGAPQPYSPNSIAPTQGAMPAPMGPAAPTGPRKGTFAALVAQESKGQRLDQTALDALKERFLLETVMPSETTKKGSTKAAHEAAAAKFQSQADRWISDYLKAAEPDAAASTDNGRGYLQGALQGTWDTAVAAVKGATTDTISGLGSLADYGIRNAKGNLSGSIAAWQELLKDRGLSDQITGESALDRAGRVGEKVREDVGSTPTIVAKGADALSEFGTRVADDLTSQGSLDARKGLDDLMARDASSGEIAAYIAANPSAATGMLGQTLGMIVPAMATGGMSAAVRASSVAGKLASGGRMARVAGRALENAPAITAAGLGPSGDAVGSLRRGIDKAPLATLLDSESNKAIYDSITSMMGEGPAAEAKFRQLLFKRSEDATLSSAIASNMLVPGVMGAPAERALVGAVARGPGKSLLGTALKTGVGEAGQEAIAAIPDTAGQNISEAQYTGKDVPTMKGLGTNAMLSAGMGLLVGGAATVPHGLRENKLRKKAAATPADTPPSALQASIDEGLLPPGTVPAAAATPADVTPASIMSAPGEGVTDADAAAAVTAATEAAHAATAGKRKRESSAKLDAAGVIAQAQFIAEKSAGDAWATMTGEQRLGLVESAAEVLNKYAQKEEVAPTLAAIRNTVPQTPVTQAAPVVEPAPAPAPAPVVEPAPAPAPVVEPAPVAPVAPPAPAPPAPVAGEAPKLPPALAGGAPRYGNGPKMWTPQFESDVDKALYIVGNTKTKSPSDAAYRQFLVDSGFSPGSIDGLAATVRAAVAAQMQTAKPGTAIKPAKTPMPATNVMSMVGQAVPAPAKKAKPLKNAAATPAKKPKPLTKAPKPPKSEAPATQPGPAVAATPAATPTRESAADAVARIAPALSKFDSTELTHAMELAREGDSAELSNVTSSLQRTFDISASQAAQLRKEGESLTPSKEGLTEKPVEAPAAKTPAIEAASIDTQDESPTVRSILDRIRKKRASSMGDGQTKAGDLLRAIQDLPILTEYQQWLARKLAPIMDSLGVSLSANKSTRAHGTFTLGTNNVNIATARPSTIIHEMLHAATVGLLFAKASNSHVEALQVNFKRLYNHGLAQLVIQRSNPDSAYSRLDTGSKERVIQAFKNQAELITYALTDPSARDVFSDMPAPTGTDAPNAWGAFKDMLAKFYRDFMGANAGQANFLNSMVDNTAALVDYAGANPDDVARAGRITYRNEKSPHFDQTGSLSYAISLGAFEDTKADPTGADVTPVGNAQRLGETLAQAAYGLERSEQEIHKAGGTVTPENSPYFASRNFTSAVAENRNHDNATVVAPLANWIATNWRTFLSPTWPEFRVDLDKFLQNHHALYERNPTVWANNAELKNGMELQRASLIDDAYEGKMTGPELNAALIKMAEKYAVEPQEQWSTKHNSRDPARAREALADVATRGFTPASLAELNTLLQAARDQSRTRMNASGITTPEDPFADRGWKWYVPLKGSLDVGADSADFDLGAYKGSAKEFRTRNLASMDGRSTNAANAMEQLIVDMNDAAMAEAESNFKRTLFEYVRDNLKLLGATIRRWEGTPKGGYTTQTAYTKNGKPYVKETFAKTIKNPEFGFIYNDGTNHYEVMLPEGSQLDRGLKKMRSVVHPSDFEESTKFLATGMRTIGGATNIIARAYTTWSPTWQLTVAFMRDINALPLTVAVEVFDSPWKARVFATEYAKNLLGNTLAISHTLKELEVLWTGDKSALAEYARLNPGSYPARLLAYRAAGGSTEFSQGLNRTKAGSLLFKKAASQDAGLLSVETGKDMYDNFNRRTGDWAAMLENKGRVAAWEALQVADPNMTPEHAAAIVKGALDYGQSGEWGKMINMWHAFYRIGATSVDTMRRAFSTKEGKPDVPKIAKWMPFMGAMGAVAYTVMTAIMGDDEDDLDENGKPKKNIRKYNADTLTQKLILPDGKGGAYGMAIGLGLPQLMMAPGILGAAWAAGHITPEEAVKAYYETVARNTPVMPSGWKDGDGLTGFAQSWLVGLLFPTIGMPIGESVTNVNAFDAPIHTSHPQAKKYASDQGMPDTPQWWKDRAREAHELTGGLVDMYPETIRHFTKAWGGQPANAVIRWTLDFKNKEEQGMDSRAVRTATRLGVNDADYYYRNEARKTIDIIELSQRKLERAKKDGEDAGAWERANPDDAKRLAAYKPLDAARDAYYKRKAAIRDNKLMTPQGKKEQMKLADGKLRVAVNKAQRVIEATE